MAKSYNRIWVHAIWATKNRTNLIESNMEDQLYAYMAKKFKENGCPVWIINGHKNHVHCLFLLNPHMTLDEIIQRVKGSSSHFVNSNDLIPQKFRWQAGYRSFSVSESASKRVYQYIKNQKEHHRKKTFIEEYQAFIKLHKLELEGDKILK